MKGQSFKVYYLIRNKLAKFDIDMFEEQYPSPTGLSAVQLFYTSGLQEKDSVTGPGQR